MLNQAELEDQRDLDREAEMNIAQYDVVIKAIRFEDHKSYWDVEIDVLMVGLKTGYTLCYNTNKVNLQEGQAAFLKDKLIVGTVHRLHPKYWQAMDYFSL